MPEIIDEVLGAEKPVESKPVEKASYLTALLLGAALSLGGNVIYDNATEESKAEAIITEHAKVRDSLAYKFVVESKHIPDTTFVSKDSTGKVISSVFAPARTESVNAKFNQYTASEADSSGFIFTLSRVRDDSLAYKGKLIFAAGETVVIKFQGVK